MTDISRLEDEFADLVNKLNAAHAENEEQARLLGAGGSREAALMARVEALSREITKLDDLRAKESATNTQLMADQERFVERIKELRDEVAAVDEAAQTDHTKPTALIVRNVIEQRDQAMARIAELEKLREALGLPEERSAPAPAPVVGEANGWFDCSVRRPGNGARVWIYVPGCYGGEHAIYRDEHPCPWVSFRDDDVMWSAAQVTHWRPLPPPPVREGE